MKFKDGELNESNAEKALNTSVRRKSTLYDESNYTQTPGTIRNKSQWEASRREGNFGLSKK